MDKIKITFICEDNKDEIECNKNDLIIEAIKKFERKINKNFNNIKYYFKGKKIELDKVSRLKELIENENQIILIGISFKETLKNKYKKYYKKKIIKSNVICPKCLAEYELNNNCLINFEDYKILLSDCIKGHKISDILIEEFDQKKFIINNDNDKNYKCNIHQNEIFCSYCLNCKENLCFICENNHNHKKDIISYNTILFQNDEYIDNLNEKMNDFREKLNRLFEDIEKIKSILDYEKTYLEKYYNLIATIIDNYDINKRNYWMIKNIKQINFDNVFEELDSIIKTNNLKQKFHLILSVYNKMNYKNNIRIQYNYSKKNPSIRLFGEDFVKNNKKRCKLIIDNKETDLIEFYENKEVTPKDDKLEIILKDINKITDMSNMFNKCFSLISVPDLNKINISSVTDINHMFCKCTFLKSLPDISKWDTSSINDMSFLFYKCAFLDSLPDISKWNTSSVTKMNHLFANCQSLKNLPDISKWDISSVQYINSMFSTCHGLSYLPDISNWNTSSVKNMAYLFNFCSSLRVLPDISKWNISSCSNISFMFSDCILLTSLTDISNWDTSSVTDMKKMFNFCKLIKTLPDISQWNTSYVYDMSNLFSHCYSLLDLPDLSKWNTSSLTKIDNMFSFCNSLNYFPDISTWNTANIKSMKDVFKGCDKLESKPEFKNNKNCTII